MIDWKNQINDYYKAFDHVADCYLQRKSSGIEEKDRNDWKTCWYLHFAKRGTITTIQKPQAYSVELDAEILFKILRKQEYEEILFNKYKHLPDVSEFKYYSECKKNVFRDTIRRSIFISFEAFKKEKSNYKRRI